MPNNHKVLIFLPFLTRGGAEIQGLALSKGLKQRGFEVLVCAFQLKGKKLTLIPELEKHNIEFIELPFEMSVFQSILGQIKTIWGFRKFLVENDVKVIVPFTWYPNLLSAVSFRLTKVKTCFWNQRSVDHQVNKFKLEKFIPLQKLIFVSNSKAGLQFIVDRFKVGKDNITIINNGLQPFRINPEIRKEKNHLEIVMVANFFREKDFTTVLEAFSLLCMDFNNLKLSFIGGGGSKVMMNEAKAKAYELKLCHNVSFKGGVNDIRPALESSHIGILSSFSEGCPNSILEYMMAELPVVATKIDAIVEMDGSEHFKLFEPRNIEELYLLLKQLVENTNERIKTGTILRNKVVQNYSVDNMINNFIELINKPLK